METQSAPSDQIFPSLKKIFAQLTKRSLTDIEAIASIESRLKEDLGIDSVESLDFLYSLESFFSIQISDEEAGRLQKVSDVISLIEKKTKK